jgi:ABC-type proline/glycine betaine transport system ATPase subunit
MIIVTHELDSIFTIAGQRDNARPRKKTIVAEGRPQDLLANPPSEWVKNFLTRAGLKEKFSMTERYAR